MLCCLPSSRAPATALGPSKTEASPDMGFPSPPQAWITGIRAGSIASCGNHVKASCHWIAFNAEAAGEAQGKGHQARLEGWEVFASMVPPELGDRDPRRLEGKLKRLSLCFPRNADSPTSLGLHCKTGCPCPVSQVVRVPGSIMWAMGRLVTQLVTQPFLCPFLQVCWASCHWSARMEARGLCLSSAATQVSWVSTSPTQVHPMPPPYSTLGHRGAGYHLPYPQRHLPHHGLCGRAQVLSPGQGCHAGLSPRRGAGGAAGIIRDRHPQAG